MTFTIHTRTSRLSYDAYPHSDIPGYHYSKFHGEIFQLENRTLDCGAVIRIHRIGEHIFLGFKDFFSWRVYNSEEKVDIQVDLVGKSYHRGKDPIPAWLTEMRSHYGYGLGSNNPQNERNPIVLYMEARVTTPDGVTTQVELPLPVPRTGKVQVRGSKILVSGTCMGTPYEFEESFASPAPLPRNTEDYPYYKEEAPLKMLQRHLEGSEIEGGKDVMWAVFLEHVHQDATVPLDGLKTFYKQKAIAPNLKRLEKEQPVAWTFFRYLHGKKTMAGVRNNQLLGVFLKSVGEDYDKLLKGLQDVMLDPPFKQEGYVEDPLETFCREACQKLPGALEKVEALAAQKDFRKQKTAAGQADGLGATTEKAPLLRAAIEKGDIPIGIFHQPGKDGQPINREFDLWEKALAQKGWLPVLSEIAQDASRRTTYERDITPYLMFMFRICKYLDRHAPLGRKKTWKAMPKFVKSQWDLEMDDDNDENGTVKRRSAFTPVADNEAGVIEVPYVAVCVTGVSSQWCYSRHFYIFEEGFTDPESGGMVTRDVEPKLNGRDDYGLCYYTLTGTSTARGYPTFLIIFEKRGKGRPFVHFHRVRPCRSAKGVITPACDLVEACYQYMAGNIPASDIHDQQGDLIFIAQDHDPIKAKAKVEDPKQSPVLVFESHSFQSLDPESDLSLFLSTAKTPKNRLGYVYAPKGMVVNHPEHDNLEPMPSGWYEVRRCKSWEANPKAIWSLTID